MTFIIGTPHRHHCGHQQWTPGGSDFKTYEADMQSCSHCQRSLNISANEGAYCSRCQHLVCHDGPCAAQTEKFGCLPFIAYLEKFFAMHGRLAQYRKLAGLDPVDPQNIIVPR